MEPNPTQEPADAAGADTYRVLDAIHRATAVSALYERRCRRVTLATELPEPLGHRKRSPVHQNDGHTIPGPITKEEEAYLVAAAVGITGPIQADLPYTPEGGGRTMMNLYGRTIASPDASHTQRLIVLNDAGSWFIKGPRDFDPSQLPELVELVQKGRWTEWYDRMRVQISTRRAGIPREVPYQAPFNIGTTNLPNTTYFLPIADLSAFYLNVVFSGFEKNVGVVLRDLRNGAISPAGIEESLKSKGGPLDDSEADMQATVEQLSELIRSWTANERGQIFANLSRAAQELNLDGFPHFGGRFRAWAEELDFQLLRVPMAKLTRGNSKLLNLATALMMQPALYSWFTWLLPSKRRLYPRHVEIPLALEKDGQWLIKPYCPPFYETMEEAVRVFVDEKFGALRAQLADGLSALQRDKAQALSRALDRYAEDEIKRVARFAQYCLDRYGVFPYCGEPGPLSMLEAFQVHVADPDYYSDHYRTELSPRQKRRAKLPVIDGTPVGEGVEAASVPHQASGIPPWAFEADHIMLLYDVPVGCLRNLKLPRELALVTTHSADGPIAEMLVGFNHIVDFKASDAHPKWVPPYDEIAVSVRVRHENGSEGSFYLRLHLDQRIPIDMGVVHFGYPKERAHIQRYERMGCIDYRAQLDGEKEEEKRDGKTLYALKVEPREDLGARLRAVLLWTLFRIGQVLLDPGATRAFFQHEHDNQVLQTSWVVTPKASAVRFVNIRNAVFPFLADGLKIERVEAMKLKLAMHSHLSKGRSAVAEAIPARASAWVRWRLATVAWTRPLMNAAVRWLGR